MMPWLRTCITYAKNLIQLINSFNTSLRNQDRYNLIWDEEIEQNVHLVKIIFHLVQFCQLVCSWPRWIFKCNN